MEQSRTRAFSFVVLCIIVFGTGRFFFFFCPSFKQNSVLEKVTQVSLVFPQKQNANQSKNTGKCFTTNKIDKHVQNSGTLSEKKIHPKKSLRSVLHQAIQLLAILGFHFLNAAIRF